MRAKLFVPLAAGLAFSTVAGAQNGAGIPLHNLPGAMMDRQQIIEAHQRQAQAEIRRAWLASGHKAASPDVAPAITLGKVPVKTFTSLMESYGGWFQNVKPEVSDQDSGTPLNITSVCSSTPPLIR